MSLFSKRNNVTGIFNSYKSLIWIKGSANKISSKSKIINSNLRVNGVGNEIDFGTGLLNKCIIRLSGKSNSLIIEDNETISNLIIHIRGEGNIIRIGKGTSIGGARIINIGIKNTINIGESCMLSDNIEIWASDSHPIFNKKTGEVINLEKPINIGNKVWIGTHTKILKGTIIKDGAIIAMGTILNGEVPNNVIYGDNPNRILKQDVYWEKFYTNKILH